MTDWSPSTREQVRRREVTHARGLLHAGITEAEWQEQVIDLAHMLGWGYLHVRRSIGKGRQWTTATNVVGWPDIWAWHPRRGFVALELKSSTGKATAEQEAVLASLAAAGARTMVARPEDLDAVRALLSSGERTVA